MEHMDAKWNNSFDYIFISFCVDIDNAKWKKKYYIISKRVVTMLSSIPQN